MLVLAGIVSLHITTIILLLVATIDNAWWFTDTVATDVWGRWELSSSVWHYTNLKGDFDKDYLQVVQSGAVLACIFSIVGLFVFVAQLFTLGKGHRFTFSGVLMLISSVCVMIAVSVYTDIFHKEDQGWYGHSFILAWISFALTFILGVIYIVLRKKSE
ncbi:epithelial membrane protein 1 [Esox lucius]|uniref:Epithelial membrane protein 1 n=1 Tax=Esox lucius TaxID=8010 RepID=A0AAY5K7M5_ESOLU|nr:epithelial membrane protein 1 [Esox lucius]